MTDIGSSDDPLRFLGKELQLDVFDGNDPPSGTRRWWFRSDLSVNGSDAVIRVNNNGEIVDVPVFENSTSVEAGIDTRFGVVAPSLSEPAFVPLTDPADATFDFARMETPGGAELSFHNRTAPGPAIPDSEIDHFETDSLSNYNTTGTALSINSNSPVYEGSQSLKCDSTGDSDAFSTSGLSAYPKQGYVFETWVQVVSGSGNYRHASMLFGQDINNHYEVWVAPGGSLDNTAIRKRVDGGSRTSIQSSNAFTPSNSTWYKLEVEWHDGSGSQPDNTIVLNVEDTSGTVLDTISVQDSDFAGSEGFGVRSAQNSDTQAWDRAHITVPVSER